MTSLKGVDPDGSQRAWDLFVKSRFVDDEEPRPRARSSPPARRSPTRSARCSPCSASCSRRRSKSAAFTSSTPGPRPSARRAPSSSCSRPASTSRSRASRNSSMSPTSWPCIARSPMSCSNRTCVIICVCRAIKGGKRQIVTAEPSRRLQGLSENPRRAHRRRSRSARASPRRATIFCSPSSPTAATPPSICASSSPATRTSTATSSTL